VIESLPTTPSPAINVAPGRCTTRLQTTAQDAEIEGVSVDQIRWYCARWTEPGEGFVRVGADGAEYVLCAECAAAGR